MEGSVELSHTNSPACAENSTMAPCSTIIMHWPSFTAIMEPLEMMLSSPLVLALRLPVRFTPLVIRTFSGMESQ